LHFDVRVSAYIALDPTYVNLQAVSARVWWSSFVREYISKLAAKCWPRSFWSNKFHGGSRGGGKEWESKAGEKRKLVSTHSKV
jgi:hypothetical protein